MPMLRSTAVALVVLQTFAMLPRVDAADLTIEGYEYLQTPAAGTMNFGQVFVIGNGRLRVQNSQAYITILELGDNYTGGNFILDSGYVSAGRLTAKNANTIQINSGTLRVDTGLYLGTMATARLTMSGGYLQADQFYLGIRESGPSASGVFTQTGGTVEAMTAFRMAYGSGSSGSYSISGGQLIAPTIEMTSSGNSSSINLNGGVISTGAFTKTGGLNAPVLTLNGGTIRATSSASSFIPAGTLINLTDATTTIDTNGRTIGIASLIHAASFSSGGGLVVTGGGSLSLADGNYYYAPTMVTGSTALRLAGGSALVNSTLNAVSGTVQFLNQTSGTLGGLAGSASFALTNDLGQALTLTVGGNAESTSFSGALSGAGSLVKQGAGTMVLTGASTYTGSTAVNGGIVAFNNASAFGNGGSIVINGGTLRWNGNTADLSGRLNLGAGGGTLNLNGNNVTFASAIGGTGPLTIFGGVSLGLTFTGQTAHTGDTTVHGNVNLSGPGSARGQLGGLDGSRIAVNNTGRLTLNGDNVLVGTNPFTNIVLRVNSGGSVSSDFFNILPEVVLDGGWIIGNADDSPSLNYTFGDGLSTAGTGKTSQIFWGAISLPTAVTVNAGDTLAISAIVTGNNNLVKQGTGVLALSGQNNFVGTTIVNGGILAFTSAALGNAANKITLNGGGLAWAGANTTDISGRLNAIGAGGATLDTNTNDVTLASMMSGSGGITKNGAGALRLTASNSYTGGTVINSGSLTVAADNALGTGRVRVQGGTLDVEDDKAFSNDVVFGGGTYRRTVTGSLTGKVNATSDLAGGIDTTAKILAGSLATTSTLVTSFSGTSAATNDAARGTDVYSFVGTGTNTFVLELSSAALTEGMIGWLSNDEWVLAIEGNIGNTATQAMQGFDGSYTEFLTAFGGVSLAQSIGAYGFDQETQAAWAVLNHNSDFAVIPEPATTALLVLGGFAFLARRRWRCVSHGESPAR